MRFPLRRPFSRCSVRVQGLSPERPAARLPCTMRARTSTACGSRFYRRWPASGRIRCGYLQLLLVALAVTALGWVAIRGISVSRISISRRSVIGVAVGGRAWVGRVTVVVGVGVPRSDAKAGATDTQVNTQTLCFCRAQWKCQCAQTNGRQDQGSRRIEPMAYSRSRHDHLQI
jgi:hypothetical protein